MPGFVTSKAHRVSTQASPYLKVFHQHHSLHLTLDSGAETNMIKTRVAKEIGAIITKTQQSALQADGFSPLAVVGEIHLMVSHGN